MATLQDNRKYQAMTVAQADQIFLQIAKLNAAIEKLTAAHKKKLAELELAHKDQIDPINAEMKAQKAELSDYCRAHTERFESPRKHPVGQIGTYGITTDPAYVTITDEDAFIQFALENGYEDLTRVKHTPDKNAALRRIMAGEQIPGAVLTPAGDVVKLSFKKGYAEALNE